MQAIDSSAGAFLAGLVTSVHCVVMCGPLACTWALGSARSKTLIRDSSLYHAGRLAAYSGIGAAAGALGAWPMGWIHQGGGLILPWLLVLAFVVVALGMDRWMPKPLFLSKPIAAVRRRAMSVPAGLRAALLGGATPLLPCGPLYLMFGLAAANGSALKGAIFTLSFGLGTLPLLWLAQTQMRSLNFRFGTNTSRVVLRSLAFCAALVMAWRLRGTLTGEPVTCH